MLKCQMTGTFMNNFKGNVTDVFFYTEKAKIFKETSQNSTFVE